MLWVTFPFPIPGLLSMATGHRWQISVRELSLPTVSPSPFPGLMSDLTPPSGRAPSWLIHTVGLLWWYAGSGSRAFPFHRMSCLCVWRALLALQLHPTHRLTACPLFGDFSSSLLVWFLPFLPCLGFVCAAARLPPFPSSLWPYPVPGDSPRRVSSPVTGSWAFICEFGASALVCLLF